MKPPSRPASRRTASSARPLLSYLEDLHDARIIEDRLKNFGKRIPLSEVVKNLGLDDVDD